MSVSDCLNQVLFWASALTLVYAFAGYPVLVCVLARLRARPVTLGGGEFVPSVSALVVVRNGEDRIEGRVRNLLACDYPADKFEILVVSDGSQDRTVEVLHRIDDARLRVLARDSHRGKASGLNEAVAVARGEVVVMGDVRQRFAPDAIRAFVRPFADSRVGAVCGNLEVVAGADAVSGGVDVHWRLENAIRRSEAAFDSSVGYTGAICAIRRAAFRPIPEDTILDDVVIPMTIVLQGYRVVYESGARGHDPQPFSQEIERNRKRRTMSGNFQMFFRYPGWLLPWRNRLWWQLISHKYLRLLGFPLMVVCFLTVFSLLDRPFYLAVLLGQAVFYALAFLGLLIPRLRSRLVSLPASFVFVNWRTMIGLRDYLCRRGRGGWERAA